MKAWFNEAVKYIPLIMAVMTAIGIVSMFVIANEDARVRDIRRYQYLADHKCVVVNFAGKDAEPVYQCDNGMIMRKQIP